MRFTLIQYSNQFALGGWSWTVLTYRVQRKVLTSDLGRSYLLPTRALATRRRDVGIHRTRPNGFEPLARMRREKLA